jgi:formylglycine-generating enzyme required for sulfatase activity
MVGLRRDKTRTVTITAPFAVGRYEVTFDEWDACVADGGCDGYRPADEGWGRGARPVIHVSWLDAQGYVRWLSTKSRLPYRLLSEAEWEYASRAGSTSIYPWGNTASHELANYGEDECCKGRVLGHDTFLHTAPAGQFPPNGFGLHDMIGNVYEWVEDCYSHILDTAPTNGSPLEVAGCGQHVLRGAAWYSDPGRITGRYRAYQKPDRRDYVVGFRVARSLNE